MQKSANTLVAGPWVGEFGWELFAWQAYVRALSKHYSNTIVVCRENSKALYKDFAKDFISINPQHGQPDCWMMNNLKIEEFTTQILKDNNLVGPEYEYFTPIRIGMPPLTHHTQPFNLLNKKIVPQYIRFGTEGEKQFDYIFHIRNRQLRPNDNWSIDNWQKLRDLLGGRIACIGTKNEALTIDGAQDMRDSSLSVTMNLLRNASWAFGPSSGPMHLASLCGCPHVVWASAQTLQRYGNTWNPLKTRFMPVFEYNCHPDAEFVYKKWQDLL